MATVAKENTVGTKMEMFTPTNCYDVMAIWSIIQKVKTNDLKTNLCNIMQYNAYCLQFPWQP